MKEDIGAIQPMLLCIPDINGFTEFMDTVDMKYASRIIPALLNEIIYANDLGLKVSEIEGDAVLFYKQDKLPAFKELLRQCFFFHSEFYRKLQELKIRFKGQLDGYGIVRRLGLKIILHYGEVGIYDIGDRFKLMGTDVIKAHQFLKNSAEIEEYILFSESVLNQYEQDEIERNDLGVKMVLHEDSYNHFGVMAYGLVDLNTSTNVKN